MFWKFVLMEEYSLIILFFTTSSVIGKRRLSFIVQIIAILIGIKCIWASYSLVIKSFKSYFIFIKGMLFKVLSVGTLGAVKIPYDDETMEKHYVVVCEFLKKMSIYFLLYFVGFLIPSLLPLDGSMYVNDLFNPAFRRDILILYCFITVDDIFSEISNYLSRDTCLYLLKDPFFELDTVPFMYKKFYDYFIDKGYDSHVALKKTAIFRISMKMLPLIGLFISYIIYRYVC